MKDGEPADDDTPDDQPPEPLTLSPRMARALLFVATMMVCAPCCAGDDSP
jgi:hypothetical protein